MEINLNSLKKIAFPVYKLPNDEVYTMDGLLFYSDLVIDDRNQPGDTLGKRRMQSGQKLLALRQTILNVRGLVKHSKGSVFIDNSGKLFKYVKTKTTKIVYHKIKSVKSRDTFCVLSLVGARVPMVTDSPPRIGEEWCGVIYVGNRPWDIYEYSEYYQEPKRRKI